MERPSNKNTYLSIPLPHHTRSPYSPFGWTTSLWSTCYLVSIIFQSSPNGKNIRNIQRWLFLICRFSILRHLKQWMHESMFEEKQIEFIAVADAIPISLHQSFSQFRNIWNIFVRCGKCKRRNWIFGECVACLRWKFVYIAEANNKRQQEKLGKMNRKRECRMLGCRYWIFVL